MNKKEALKEAHRLLKKNGVDTSEMTDAEVMARIKDVWMVLELQRMKTTMEWIRGTGKFTPDLESAYNAIGKWVEPLPVIDYHDWA